MERLDCEHQAAPVLCDLAVERQWATVLANLQACKINKTYRAQLFLNMGYVKFLRFVGWLCWTRAVLVQMHGFCESVKSEWEFSLARTISSVAAAYFAALEANVKRLGYSVLEGLADVWAYALCSFKCSAIHHLPWDKRWKICLDLCIACSQGYELYALTRVVSWEALLSMQGEGH